jgi:hypothetical protein
MMVANPLRLYSAEAFHFRLQTIMHSILSTRIVLHTGRVLREGDEAAQLPTNRRDANGVRIRPDPDGTVELERLINEDT